MRFNLLSVYILLMGISGLSLMFAYIAQYGFGLMPCVLCLYQRIPYFIILAVCLVALSFYKNSVIPLLCCAVLLDINGMIALYHTGVEQHWWISFIKDCVASKISDLNSVLHAPVVRCDEPQWRLFGFTMAQYHILWAWGWAAFCLIAFIKLKKQGVTCV